MSKRDVIINYFRMSDYELSTFSQNVSKKLTGNVNFKFDAATLTMLDERTTTYVGSLVKARSGAPHDITEKNVQKELVCACLHDIAMEVNVQAKGDIVKLQSSGFNLPKEPKKKGVLPKPTKFKVASGTNKGDLLCEVNSNPDAFVYNFYSAPVPAPENINEWRLTPSSTRKKNISGFTPGKEYELKCAYQGSEDTLTFSESVRIFAQ
ncbi:hypothetical protein [uncultured Acetobacteroides sp.]|uniref:hypothetical protein n=1 Tax=uncultured Acetobacteroides sp. TaxID=1760811 RepID=UPI0029F49E20|nr:hypothetical protein [uncultured Acetobacteroides sp.]